MTTLFVGAVVDRLPSPRYCEQLAFCELAPRAPLPRVSTLKRWYFQRTYDVAVGLIAPRSTFCGPEGVRLSALPEESVQWLSDAGRTLGAHYILLPTGREVTPSSRDRQHLSEYCKQLRERSGCPVVWAPGGMWEAEAAFEQASRMGAGLSLEVLDDPPYPTETLYARVTAVGARARLGRGHLEQAVQAVIAAGPTTAYLSVDAEPRMAKAVAARDAANLWAEDDEALSVVAPRPIEPA